MNNLLRLLLLIKCYSTSLDLVNAQHRRFNSFKDDVVLALTTTGTVKVWTLLGHENRNSEPLYEHESKQIRCLNALAMTCCPYNQRTVLIVCSKYWQVGCNFIPNYKYKYI